MSEPPEKRITITTEAPEAGPTAFIAALVSWGLGAVVVLAAIGWLGYRDATDIHARDFNPVPLFFAAAFGLLGVFFLFRGVLHTLRHRKYGSSALDCDEARLGQTLQGVVRTERDLPQVAKFTARLRCDLHATTRSVRGGGTTTRTCLWESSQEIPGTAVSAAGIPIAIAIPANGVASGTRKTHSGASERVTWVLEIKAPLPGMDYYAEFKVKVKARPRGIS